MRLGQDRHLKDKNIVKMMGNFMVTQIGEDNTFLRVPIIFILNEFLISNNSEN